jgi:hypothetical protein
VDNSKRTAIARRSISKPLRWLIDDGEYPFWPFNVLHHGCGRPDNPDRARLKAASDSYCEYDPNWGPSDREILRRGDFSKVVSFYVLNVLPPKQRRSAIRDIALSTRGTGFALVAVRSSVVLKAKSTSHEDGVLTSAGTFQKAYTEETIRRELLWHFRSVTTVRKDSDTILVLAALPTKRPRRKWY